ncbi:hypothetical protein BHE74_00000829 [Ensete ventricosum]|nr:hypothetical protein BHE74_00000829 [Ensete ventricosum]
MRKHATQTKRKKANEEALTGFKETRNGAADLDRRESPSSIRRMQYLPPDLLLLRRRRATIPLRLLAVLISERLSFQRRRAI